MAQWVEYMHRKLGDPSSDLTHGKLDLVAGVSNPSTPKRDGGGAGKSLEATRSASLVYMAANNKIPHLKQDASTLKLWHNALAFTHIYIHTHAHTCIPYTIHTQIKKIKSKTLPK